MNRFGKNRRFKGKFRKPGNSGHYNNMHRNRNNSKLKNSIGKLQRSIRDHYFSYAEKLGLYKRPLSERIVLVGFSALSVFLVLGLIVTIFFSFTLPRVANADKLVGEESTVFFDQEGKVLYTVYEDENRENIPFEDIPEIVVQATLAIEDDQFYKHKGYDLGGIIKAVLSEFGVGGRRGGSTITQQFVKNTFLSSQRTYTRKVKEIILATRVERRFSKNDILEMYLNKIPYGGTAYGVQKASDVFFGKDAKDLTLAEAAVLAALPKAPSYYSPYGQHKYTVLAKEFTPEELADRSIENVGDLFETEYSYGLIGQEVDLGNGQMIYLPGRADEVLKRMEDLKYVTEEEKNTARVETHEIQFKPYRSAIQAPHFVFYVRELLERQYGKDLVETGGLKVYTTLDMDLQTKAEEIIAEQVASNSSRGYDASNAAMVSIDPENGQVLAMVGSADYFNEDIDGNVNIVTSLRQPGSSFKPLVYAAAFLNGYGPGTVLFDVPTTFGTEKPDNYDGQFWGPMTARRGLGQSRNIPAIKAYFLAGEQLILWIIVLIMGGLWGLVQVRLE